jgi:hypothetical protein
MIPGQATFWSVYGRVRITEVAEQKFRV